MSSDASTLTLPESGTRLERMLRSRLVERLDGLVHCHLTLVDADGTREFGDPNAKLSARVSVDCPQFYRHVAFGGSVGAGESFMLGHWRCDDLTALIRIMVRNRDLLDGMETGVARVATPLLRWFHRRNRNTLSGSRRNISAHYDLGNDLFKLFLDDTMMYSSAAYRQDSDTLEDAQRHKLDRICQKLQLVPEDHVLEIGTGWGGFAIHAATHYGCRVTTTTISREQHAEAKRRVKDAGLSDRITLLLQDYRDLEGQFDKLVSIEMIEAVGHHYLPTYLSRCGELLAEDGMMLLQAITIEDHRYQQALTSVDFIQRFIFPGSFIPSVSAITSALAATTDMRLYHLEDIGPSYALTLREWRRRFCDQLDQVRELGYPEEFIRMWLFYLSYCEGGFIERSIGNAQMLLTRPLCRRPQLLDLGMENSHAGS